MTSNIDVIRAWNKVPLGDAQGTIDFLAEDFEQIGADGSVQSKAQYAGMIHMMYGSLPDMHGFISELREEDGAVLMTYHFEGTFQNNLDLSALGMGVIPASGEKIVWPEDTVKVTVEGDKIRRIEPHGGVIGSTADFLAPLMG